jgi:hypothetical protein
MSDEEGQKKELLDLLSKAPEEASRLEKLARASPRPERGAERRPELGKSGVR